MIREEETNLKERLKQFFEEMNIKQNFSDLLDQDFKKFKESGLSD